VETGSQPARDVSQFIVNDSVAIVVLTVADLLLGPFELVTGLHFAVDTVLLFVSALPEPATDRTEILVLLIVTVIVHPVADLGLGPFEGVALLLLAADAGGSGMESSSLATGQCGQLLVHLAVAVVVETIAQFLYGTCHGVALVGGSPQAGGNRMITFSLAAGHPSQILIREPVAVVVLAVTKFY